MARNLPFSTFSILFFTNFISFEPEEHTKWKIDVSNDNK